MELGSNALFFYQSISPKISNSVQKLCILFQLFPRNAFLSVFFEFPPQKGEAVVFFFRTWYSNPVHSQKKISFP